MNYIAWNCVVSLFPNSAFIRRRSFVSRQEDLSWRRSPEGFHAWFNDYAKENNFSVIGITHKRYKEVETGERYVGDKLCWIIPVIQSGLSSVACVDGFYLTPFKQFLPFASNRYRDLLLKSWVTYLEPPEWIPTCGSENLTYGANGTLYGVSAIECPATIFRRLYGQGSGDIVSCTPRGVISHISVVVPYEHVMKLNDQKHCVKNVNLSNVSYAPPPIKTVPLSLPKDQARQVHKAKQNNKKANNNMSLDTYSAVAVVDQNTDNGMLDASMILNGNSLPEGNVTLNGSAILDGNATPKVCGSTRCTVPRDAQILKRCAGCQAKYYCCRACQIIDWPIHRVLCDRKAAERPTEGWEDAIAQFHDTYGVFVLSYGIGLVFAVSDLNPAYIPTPMEWCNLWQTYACAVEIKVTEVSNAVGNDAYTVKFLRTFPVRVDTYLSVSRLRGYRNSVSRTDYTVGVIFVVVPYERGPVQAVTTTTRILELSEVTSPAIYMASSRGTIKDVINDLAA
ncbi:hypothetical protein CVT26_001418 [Gymnopilus dilepis]|uniref:MYND-type domain-containing protein n=1 Tax=Gymnopilus dilepis TaxID=231916 RepID=A0A409W7D1_9AGAR|nr:hypothetical protein CVT26_001418 [Gymnopilus dilepis]